ncbi:MAG: TolC family protein [Gemmatimonadales bacterium]|jgi:multidrug efflux system outer membrane protein
MHAAVLLLAVALQGAHGDTTRLSLQATIDRALEANPGLRAERASARAAGQMPAQASQAFLPTVSLELTGMRTTDPVAVFGLTLRQAAFTPQGFDVAALNDPDPYGGWDAVASAQLPIFAPEGLYGFAAARKAAAAGAAQAERAAGATRFFVIRAYWDAQLAARQVETLDTALTAVRAHRAQAAAMHEQGLVTSLDARFAGLKQAEIEVRRLAAAAHARNALAALRAMLALPDDQPIVLTDSLRSAAAASQCAAPGDAACAADLRADLEAYRFAEDAARLAVKRAWASQLPSVAAFGMLAHRALAAPFAEGSGDWTVGIAVRWPILRGLAGVGAVRAARAERQQAAARLEAAERQAELEIARARDMLAAARERVAVAERAEREAREALDQARLRYRTGSAPITELLDVQAAATAASLNHVAARRDLFVAAAALDLAYGVYDR